MCEKGRDGKTRIYARSAILEAEAEDLFNKKTKLRDLSPRANYTDRESASCRRSYCQLLQIEGATWSL
jgi:hypothetical protein